MRWASAIWTSDAKPAATRAALACLLALVLVAVPARAVQSLVAERAESSTQRLIVKLRDVPATASSAQSTAARVADRVARLAAAGNVALSYVRPMALGAHVVQLDHPVPISEARAIAQRLAGNADVEYAQPDRRMKAQFVPNDEFINAQTYLHDDPAGIGAFSAWDVTRGSEATVVAVVDTGYRPHAAMAGRILPGYDFVSDPIVANDGDGRDADASDPGDWISQSDVKTAPVFNGCDVSASTWHGTETSGIIGANTNDRAWTAGIDWSARILPVRVLGKCFGADSDIIDGIAWAAGLAVPGVPGNPTPAQVINLSLGEAGECAPGYAAVMMAALAHGVTRAIVASAGNDGADAADNTPSNCPGVISVGATNSAGGRASYSNFGAALSISAPGGQTFGPFAAIYLLDNLGTTVPTADSVTVGQGTSYAAPMVAGVVSLMLAVAPTLSADQVRALLSATAKPFPAGSDCTTAICGAGIVDGHGAVVAAQAAAPPNYEGLWWNSPGGSEAGWGINLAHQGDTIFASWFTFDLSGKPWWLVMTAGRTAPSTYTGTLFQGTGPPFDSVPFPALGSPGGATGAAVGAGTLTFSDTAHGTFAYTVNGIAQTKAITRQTFGPLPACAFGAQTDLALTSNYQDLWWASPAGSEAGWGINLTHEGDTIFATWYTYDHDRTPMWLVATAGKIGTASYGGDLFRLASGPPFNAVPFAPLGSPGGATGSVVGAAAFNFVDGTSGTFTYTVNGETQTKSITREVFTSPGTVCH